MDKIFKALADSNRRKMLDLLKENPGMNVGTLSDYFDFSRYAVMQHLKVLADAELVVKKKKGRQSLLYLNPVPLQYIQDRWLNDYNRFWAEGLTRLKYEFESDDDE